MKPAIWTRDEILSVFALYCRMPFGKFDQRNPVVIDWAGRIGRTPSAVAMKLSNLASFDPTLRKRGVQGLKNAGNAARELWREFEADPERIAFESQCVYERIRLDTAPAISIEATDAFEIDRSETRSTDAERTVRVRLVQGFFRSSVLSSYGYKCAICRLHLPQLLTASHIVPWSVEVSRRADPRNGLALCAIHDRAFDRGLIGLDESLKLLLSETLTRTFRSTGIHDALFRDFEGKSIDLPDRFLPDPKAIEYHRDHVFLTR